LAAFSLCAPIKSANAADKSADAKDKSADAKDKAKDKSADAAKASIFEATPASLSLSAPLGGTGAAKKFTVTNTGRREGTATAALTSSEFHVTPASCRLRQRASCTLSVQFAPSGTTVTRTAKLTINGGDHVAPVVALTGVVLYADFSVSPTTLSFATAVKTAAATKIITVTNTGSFAGTPGVQVPGVSAAQFPLSNGCAASVNPNSTCSLTVGFAPTSSGTKTASIVVAGPSSKRMVALSGTIVTAKPQGQWSSWNYDNDQTGIYPWPNIAIHLHLLRDGNLLSFGDTFGSTALNFSKTFVVPIPPNGVPGAATEADDASTNLFCSGHTFLPDGRLFVAGGHQTENGDGSPNSNTFEYGPPYHWQPGARMRLGRWYPTATGLVNGMCSSSGRCASERPNSAQPGAGGVE
jgi:hypothetical protein